MRGKTVRRHLQLHFECNRGASLLEIMFAISILAVALVSVLQLLAGSMSSLAINRNRVTAVAHAEQVLRQITLLRDTGADVPGGIVEAFPEGTLALEEASLPGEIVTVAYEDEKAAPLFVSVTVQWDEIRGRIGRETLSTAIENWD